MPRQSSIPPTRPRTSPSVQPLDADVLVADDALGVVALQGKSAFIEFTREVLAGLRARRFVVLQDSFPIHQHRNAVALHDDFLRPPLPVLGWSLGDVHQTVEAAGLDPIAVRIVDLAFEASFGP